MKKIPILVFLMSIILFSCNKDETEINEIEINEFYDSYGEEIKTKVKDFLLSTGRVENLSYKTNTIFSIDPNEGVWLMEAAANVETYGRLDKRVIRHESYSIEIDNEIDNGIVKMIHSDMITKYNQLMLDIGSDEVNYELAQLIDFNIISLDEFSTSIKVDVNFVYILDDNEYEPETINVPVIGANCTYNYPSGYNSPTNSYTFQPISASPTWITGQSNSMVPNTVSSAYVHLAGSQYFYTGSYPIGSTNGLTILFQGSTDYIPYTNIILLQAPQLDAILGCRVIVNGYAWGNYADVYDKFIYMSEEVRLALPNNIYNGQQYETVHAVLDDRYFPGSNWIAGSTITTINSLGFVRTTND